MTDLVHIDSGCPYSSTMEWICGPEPIGFDATNITCPDCRKEQARRNREKAARLLEAAEALEADYEPGRVTNHGSWDSYLTTLDEWGPSDEPTL